MKFEIFTGMSTNISVFRYTVPFLPWRNVPQSSVQMNEACAKRQLGYMYTLVLGIPHARPAGVGVGAGEL